MAPHHDPRRGDADRLPIPDAAGTVLGALQRVTEREASDPGVLADLTTWRNANQRFFLTQFTATVPRTAEWLRRSLLADPSRALFLIEDATGTTIGHLGIFGLGTDVPELDNMIRGRSGGHPRLMFWAELAVIAWAFRDPNVKSIRLHVFSNNRVTIRLHRSVGFEPGAVRKLSRLTVGDEEHLVPDSTDGEPQEFGYLEMTLGREAFETSYERT